MAARLLKGFTLILVATAFYGCGGGGGGGGSTGVVVNGSVSGSSTAQFFVTNPQNQIPVTVEQFTGTPQYATIDIPYITVTVCAGATCQAIDHVVVDTGSYGFRVPAAVLSPSLLSALPVVSPAGAGTTLAECSTFLDGYMWGSVRNATLSMGGETTSTLPIQVTDDGSLPAAPSSCSSGLTDVGNVPGILGNGIIGIGMFKQDGQAYYTCTAGNCVVNLAPPTQVSNPVASLSQDYQGIILQMNGIPASGQSSATGVLTFGLDSSSDNSLTNFSVLPSDSQGYITASFGGNTFTGSFLDSGSNFYFITLPSSVSPTTNLSGTAYYTPASLLSVPVVLNGSGSNSGLSTTFSIANANTLLASNNTALNDIAATVGTITAGGYSSTADIGLPFFFGKSVAFAIEGNSLAQGKGPFYALH